MSLRLFPELPLLRRELTELAARRRTWVLRSLAGLLLIGLASWSVVRVLYSVIGMMSAPIDFPLQALGIGAEIFPHMALLLFYAVQLLMPSLICGSITIEKERNTLGTLFVTRLSPLTIVLEKLGSRILPMLTFIILTFPVLAWVYTLGGIDHRLLLATLWFLIWECVLYASIGLVCSAWYSTTVGAFIASYVLTGVLYTLTTVVRLRLPLPFPIWQELIDRLSNQSVFAGFGGAGGMNAVESLSHLFWAVWPAALASAVLILLARRFLVTRAEVSRSSILLKVFRALDSFFRDVNQWTTGGRMVLQERSTLPDCDPVAWRERSKKSLGKPHYLLRLLLVLQFPVLFVCVLAYTSNSIDGVLPLLWLLWIITAMVIVVKAATLISSERTRETLDALLSTPITNAEVLRQKISGMRRMLVMLSIPILTVHFSRILMQGNLSLYSRQMMVDQVSWLAAYFVLSLLSTWVLMQLIAWFALRLGARASTQARSFLITLVALGLWFAASAIVLPVGISLFAHFTDSGARYQDMDDFFNDRLFQRGDPLMGNVWSVAADVPGQALLLACRPDGSIIATQILMRTSSEVWNTRRTSVGLYVLRSRYTASESLLLLILVTGMQWVFYRLLRRHTCLRSARLLGRVDETVLQSQGVA
jgi:ABC-type transport system involved in multi-copper enzyme maturation permease subunit